MKCPPLDIDRPNKKNTRQIQYSVQISGIFRAQPVRLHIDVYFEGLCVERAETCELLHMDTVVSWHRQNSTDRVLVRTVGTDMASYLQDARFGEGAHSWVAAHVNTQPCVEYTMQETRLGGAIDSTTRLYF